MRDYKVTFFKIGYEKETDAKGKLVKSGKDEFLGYVVIDDNGTTNTFTLQAKAFRLAPCACLMADKVVVEQL